MGQVDSWATAEKAEKAETAEQSEATVKLPHGSRVLSLVFPFEGQVGTVLDPATVERPSRIHPRRVIAVALDDEPVTAWFADGELRRVVEDESAKNAKHWVGCWVRVVEGPHKGYFDDKVCEVLKVAFVEAPSGENVMHAYLQSPPSTSTGIEDAEMKAAWVELYQIKSWYESPDTEPSDAPTLPESSASAPSPVPAPRPRQPDFSTLSEKVVEQRQAIAREASAADMVERQLIALSDAVGAFVDSPEGREAVERKDCSSGTICEALGLSGTREDNQRIAEIMSRLGFRRVKVAKSIEAQTTFAYTWSREREAEEWSEPTQRVQDAWEPVIATWLASWAGRQTVRLNLCTTGHICDMLGCEDGYSDRLRIARIMRGLGYEQVSALLGGVELRVWRVKDGETRASEQGRSGGGASRQAGEKVVDEKPVRSFLMAFEALLALVLRHDWRQVVTGALWEVRAVECLQLRLLAEHLDAFVASAKVVHATSLVTFVDKLMQYKLDSTAEEFEGSQALMRWRLIMNEAARSNDAYGLVNMKYVQGVVIALSEGYEALEAKLKHNMTQASDGHKNNMFMTNPDLQNELLALKHVLFLLGGSLSAEENAQRPHVRWCKSEWRTDAAETSASVHG